MKNKTSRLNLIINPDVRRMGEKLAKKNKLSLTQLIESFIINAFKVLKNKNSNWGKINAIWGMLYVFLYVSLCHNSILKKMKTQIEIGTKVIGKLGAGVISRIITKSTGYVEVNYNGILKKEMAFNLTNENGESLKNKPIHTPSSSHGTYGMDEFNKRLKIALVEETGRTGLTLEQLKLL